MNSVERDSGVWLTLFPFFFLFILQIDELLSYGVNVTVYNGQVSSALPFLLSPANQNYYFSFVCVWSCMMLTFFR